MGFRRLQGQGSVWRGIGVALVTCLDQPGNVTSATLPHLHLDGSDKLLIDLDALLRQSVSDAFGSAWEKGGC
jgi:hypothetical protein